MADADLAARQLQRLREKAGDAPDRRRPSPTSRCGAGCSRCSARRRCWATTSSPTPTTGGCSAEPLDRRPARPAAGRAGAAAGVPARRCCASSPPTSPARNQLEATMAALSDLADAHAVGGAGVRRRRSGRPTAAACRLAVIAMGKCGGRELNYVSDVDVVFVAEPPATGATGDSTGRGRRPSQRAGADAGQPHDDDLRDGRLAGRRGAAPGGRPRPAGPHASPRTSPTTASGPRPGSSRRC